MLHGMPMDQIWEGIFYSAFRDHTMVLHYFKLYENGHMLRGLATLCARKRFLNYIYSLEEIYLEAYNYDVIILTSLL